MLHGSHRFQTLIEKLIALVNTTAPEPFDPFTASHLLTISNPSKGIAPLIVTAIGHNIIYIDQRLDNGHSDPGVAFFIDPRWTQTVRGWIPVGITQLFPGYYRPYVTLTADYSRPTRYNRAQQRDLAAFCNGMWWQSLSEQGFGRLTARTIQAKVDYLLYTDAEVSMFVNVEGEEPERV